MDELVSIITPVYNSGKYIGEAIKSVLSQSYSIWEMIIIDDCSTDDTSEVIKKFDDKRIKYIKLDKNSGAAIARNKALERAKGKFIAFLDADDKWKPDKLQKQLIYMLDNNVGFCFTGYEIIKEKGNRIVKVPKTLNYNQFMKNTVIGMLTVIINRDIIKDFSIVNVRKDQDSMTWAKILREGHIAYGLNESLAYYRKVEGSISNSKLNAARNHWNNCRQIEKLPLLKCIYYFIFYSINAFRKHFLPF